MAESIKKFLLLLIIFILGLATASKLFGDECTHIDRLAPKTENKSKAILTDTRHHRYTPNYRHLVSDAVEMTRLAARIHD